MAYFNQVLAAIVIALAAHGSAWAQLVIVSGKNGAITELSRAQAERLFLGRATTLADNTPVTLIDLPPGPDRDAFYFTLTGKNPVQTRAYWSRQVFTGRALPPRQASSIDELRRWLVDDGNAIGYLPQEHVDERLRILLPVAE
ncbi:MAG: hypothetical protein H6945_11995 [Zoogloeaceae bacterium]|nr:hypothetical protein [Rhodocyclaceae bacterium]MCP5236446.1 hypothetical protein [Zoogloeaceae bacterium]